jgi:hypothetical protein
VGVAENARFDAVVHKEIMAAKTAKSQAVTTANLIE